MATITSTLASSLNRLALVSAPRAGEGVVPAAATGTNKTPTEWTRPTIQPLADLVAASKPETKATAAALSEEELAKQVHAMQDKMDKLNPSLAFVVDKDTGKALIQLTDRATKEVILQFPTEAALQITKALDRFQKVQLVNRTV
jgi:flagellar protein FlaG